MTAVIAIDAGTTGIRSRAVFDDDRPVVAAYRELRQQAVKYRWYMEVQREAIGLRHHQRLDEFYPIPPLEP